MPEKKKKKRVNLLHIPARYDPMNFLTLVEEDRFAHHFIRLNYGCLIVL